MEKGTTVAQINWKKHYPGISGPQTNMLNGMTKSMEAEKLEEMIAESSGLSDLIDRLQEGKQRDHAQEVIDKFYCDLNYIIQRKMYNVKWAYDQAEQVPIPESHRHAFNAKFQFFQMSTSGVYYKFGPVLKDKIEEAAKLKWCRLDDKVYRSITQGGGYDVVSMILGTYYYDPANWNTDPVLLLDNYTELNRLAIEVTESKPDISWSSI